MDSLTDRLTETDKTAVNDYTIERNTLSCLGNKSRPLYEINQPPYKFTKRIYQRINSVTANKLPVSWYGIPHDIEEIGI